MRNFGFLFGLVVSLAVASAQSSVTNIVSGIYTNAGPSLTIGATTSFNGLIVNQGAWLENGFGVLGQSATAHNNFATVEGQGSLWQNLFGLHIGSAGSGNLLSVLNGGKVENSSSVMGASEGSSNNVARVDGPGSWWTAGELQAGAAGSHNAIHILNGGRIHSGTAAIGYMSPSRHNAMSIQGPNSISSSYDFHIGSYGSSNNRLSASGGGIVSCVTGFIGNGNDNLVWLSDAGTAWYSYGPWFVGAETGARNALVISNAAQASISGGVYLDGDHNSILLTGNGTILDTGGLDTQIVIGSTGQNNSLLVTNGAALRSWSGYLAGASNSAEVVGLGSMWNNYLLLKVGEDYALGNQLTVRAAGQVLTYSAFMSGDQGTLTVRDPGSLLHVDDLLSVGGDVGAGNALVVSNGAQLISGAGIIGGADSSLQAHRNTDNSARVSGAGSRWLVASNLIVGATGARTVLRIENGGYVESETTSVGEINLSFNNSAVVSGANSIWKSRGDFIVGNGSWNNTVSVTNGGALVCSNAVVGRNYTRFNKVTVTDPGSRWDIARSLSVGNSGAENRVIIAGGARMNTESATVDGMNFSNPGKSNSITVMGPGSHWANDGPIFIGTSSGFNELRIQNGASVAAAGLLAGNSAVPFGNEISLAQGSLNISNALELNQATLNVDGGSVRADRLSVSGAAARLSFSAGTIDADVLQFNANQVLTIGNGLDLAALTLALGSHSASNGIVVAANASLRAAGTVQASLTNSGALKPGSPTQSLFVEGALALSDAGEVEFEIGGRTSGLYDFIRVRDFCLIGGRIRLKLAGGFLPASNDVLSILNFPSGSAGQFLNASGGARVAFENSNVSCRVEYRPTEIRLVDFHNANPGAPEIDDAWALRYFGHAPLTEAEKHADPDGDGHSTYQEYLAGTVPTDGGSVLKMLPLTINPLGQSVLCFQCESNKTYSVLSSSDLLSWTELDLISGAPEGICEWIDSAITGAGRRFYRIDLLY